MKRRPTHQGEMLREDFLPDFALSTADLAKAAGAVESRGHTLPFASPLMRGAKGKA